MDLEGRKCESAENINPAFSTTTSNRDVKIQSGGYNGEYVDVVNNSGEKGIEDDTVVAERSASNEKLPPLYGMNGRGLRKWRRIRRDFVRDGIPNSGSVKMLKRGSADLVNPSEMKQRENSVSSPDSDSESYSYVSVEDDEKSKVDNAPLSWRTGGRDKIHQVSGTWDPLVDCVQTLQSTQEALEQELQKFGELGRELRHYGDESIRTSSSIGSEFCVPSTSESPTSDFGTEIPDVLISLTKNIEIFEKQIQETKVMLREKETEIAQLQSTVNKLNSSNEDLQRSIDLQLKLYEETETQVGTLYKEKMEAEILYLVIADMSIATENQMKLLVTEQKLLLSAQAQELQKVANLECRAADLKDKAEGMKKGTISKFSFYFFVFILLVLLYFMFEIFLSKISSKSSIVILPT